MQRLASHFGLYEPPDPCGPRASGNNSIGNMRPSVSFRLTHIKYTNMIYVFPLRPITGRVPPKLGRCRPLAAASFLLRLCLARAKQCTRH
jgi:hypothetical protein